MHNGMHKLEEKDSLDNYYLKGEILYRLVDDLELLVVPNGRQRQVIRAIPFERQSNSKKKKCIKDNFITIFQDERDERLSTAVVQIAKHQAKNRRNFNTKRKASIKYFKGDLVALKCIQFDPGGKLKPKYT